MREFSYFFFENFDADNEAQNPNNPRNFPGKASDEILSQMADHRAVEADPGTIQRLVTGGVLRREGGKLAFDCPVFLKEDAAVLHDAVREKAASLTDMLERRSGEWMASCSEIQNGFCAEQNLYHILCGMILDGYFFDYLSGRGALATSRLHPSGLDYLTVIYENCEELQTLSDGLLCSYNRLVNETCSLQSFGDAQGSRFDFYRFFRLLEQGNLTPKFRKAEELLRNAFGKADKNALLSEALQLVQSGRCDPDALRLLEYFGYAENGSICVPVYKPEHQKYILEIESIVESCIGEAVTRILLDLATSIEITAAKHGVDGLEIANELYHILFGAVNEELVSRGLVARPPYVPGEGRYFKCMVIY